MRIGTWNVAARLMSEGHKQLLLDQKCDVWLLTELHPRWAESNGTKVLHFNAHLSKGVMSRKQHWAAVLSVLPLTPCNDPHPASAAAVVDGVTFCSTILPWRGVKTGSPPWRGSNHAEMTEDAIRTLLKNLPKSDLVWGGDWNHSLTGREYAGSLGGRKHILEAVHSLRLSVPTMESEHRNQVSQSIDHIGIPLSWKVVENARKIDAIGLSDHDAYVVEVE